MQDAGSACESPTAVDHPWLLSGALDPGRRATPRHRRTGRDWAVDLTCSLLAFCVMATDLSIQSDASKPCPGGAGQAGEWLAMPGVALTVAALAGSGLWFRHRWPVWVALGCLPLAALALPGPGHPASLALFTVAGQRSGRVAALVAALLAVTAPLYFLLNPDTALTPAADNVAFSVLSTVTVLGWGLLVRSRRAVVTALEERAAQTETEQRLRVEQARGAERIRLAGEIHRTLATQVAQIGADADLLARHAQAGPDPARADLVQAAGVVRTRAHHALTDLRRVVGLLRDPADPSCASDAAPGPKGEDRQDGDGRGLPAPPAPIPAPIPAPAPDRGRRRSRSRPRVVDGLVVALAVGWAASYGPALPDDVWTSGPGRAAALGFGAVASLSLWWRRNHPVGIALVCVPIGAFAVPTGFVAAAVATVTVAARRPARTALLVISLTVPAAPLRVLVLDEPAGDVLLASGIALAALAAALGWGMLIRSRQQLIQILKWRAHRARAEQAPRTELARRAERTRIAREMHDVLAHRLSLVSLHAGVLEYRPHVATDEIALATEVIRTNAQRALNELRDVVGLLHTDHIDQTRGAGQRVPTLTELPDLLAQTREAGHRVHYRTNLLDPAAVPATLTQTGYRLVQEGLTNARKHAPGADVQVTVTRTPSRRLDLEVTNSLRRTDADTAPVHRIGPATIPGTGTGLVGLAERVSLAGGHLEHGPTPDRTYRLRASLPWPDDRRDG